MSDPRNQHRIARPAQRLDPTGFSIFAYVGTRQKSVAMYRTTTHRNEGSDTNPHVFVKDRNAPVTKTKQSFLTNVAKKGHHR